MRTDITRQPATLVLIQVLILTAIFGLRYLHYPSTDGILPEAVHTAGVFTPSNAAPAQAGMDMTANLHGIIPPLPGKWFDRFQDSFPSAALLVSVFLLFSVAFSCAKMMSQHLVYPTRTYLSGILFILVSCGYCFAAGDLAASAAVFLMIRTTNCYISSFVRSYSFAMTFGGSFLLGLAILLHPPAALYVLMIPVAMAIFRRTLRETIVAVAGALLPSFFYAYGYWAFGGSFHEVFISMKDTIFTGDSPLIQFPQIYLKLIPAAVLVLVIIFSLASLGAMAMDMRTKAYKIHIFMVCFFLFSCVALAFPSRSAGDMAITAIPLSFILPAFFIRNTGLVQAIVYGVLLLTAVLSNLIPFFIQFP